MIATKVQIVYFHIDEKWFYSLVIRKNNKCVPALGVQGVWNRIHHKKLELIAGDIDDADYDNFTDAKKKYYDRFVQALYEKMDSVPKAPQYQR